MLLPKTISHTYFLELLDLTVCKLPSFDFEEEGYRELTELTTLALVAMNEDYVDRFVVIHDLLSSFEANEVLTEEQYEEFFEDESASNLIRPDLEYFTYHEIQKMLKHLFGKTTDKIRVKKTLDILIDWGWVEKRKVDNTYTLPLIHLKNSITLKRLKFDPRYVESVMNPP